MSIRNGSTKSKPNECPYKQSGNGLALLYYRQANFRLLILGLVSKKSLFCFSSKYICSYHFSKEWVCSVLWISILSVKNIHDSKAYIKTNQIAQRQRSHRMVGSKHHSLVNIFCSGNAIGKNSNCFIYHRDKNSVYNKSWCFGNVNRTLAKRSCKLKNCFLCLF